MARRLGFLGPRASLTVPISSRAEMRIPVLGVGGFVMLAVQASVDRTSLAGLATSTIRVEQFDIVRHDIGRSVGLIRGTPNIVEVFGQDGTIGAVPAKDGEPIERESEVIIAFRNTDAANAHIVDVGLRGFFDTELTPAIKAPAGAKITRSVWLNGRVTLPGANLNEEAELIIRLPGDGAFTLMGVNGIVNDVPFAVGSAINVLVTGFQGHRPGSGALENFINGVQDFLSFAGQNGTPARVAVQEMFTSNTEMVLRVRNISTAPLAAQAVSITMLGTVEGLPGV